MRKKPAIVAALCAFLASYTSCTASTDSAEMHANTKYTSAIPDPPLPGLNPKAPLPKELSEALDAKGPDYKPRTHHLEPDGSPTFTNRLIREASPYLLQHAHNPVNWYPWSDEAFERARAEGKLILMSIGYSTCHWCHVMERESFEDLIIAAYMNENYIAIKVDREERPDIDSIYMTAVNMLAGRGGWPMTTILTPDREPAFGGTYFPPSRFLTLLKDVREEYVNDPGDVVAKASSLSRRIQQASEPRRPQSIPGPTAIANAATANARSFDATWGGFGGAPKFPRPSTLELLLRYHRRTGDPQALKMVEVTLEKMASGGMHDHVGGGFHRYSTDARWLVPHFEKMLYDNAQLAVAYLEGYQVTGREDFAEVARGILDYVLREMTHAKGGFFSATDADSPTGKGHDEEGLFFTWTPSEIRELLDADAAKAFQAYYGVTAGGNFEGRTILNTPNALDAVAERLNTSPAALSAQLAEARGKLYAKRTTRLPPLLDNKILTAWNGLMISALARAGLMLADRRYVEAATNAASFVLQHMAANGELIRSWRDDAPGSTGVLDDYAFFIAALLDLYEATFEPKWLHHAKTLQVTLDREFGDFNQGGYFLTRKGTKGLLTREKPSYDGAEPSGNSVALLNVLRFEQMTGDAVYRETAERGFAAFAGILGRNGRSVPKMLTALDYYLDEPLQIVIVSTTEDEPKVLMDVLRKAFVPNKVLSVGMEGVQIDAQARELPLVAGKKAQGDKPTAYVCRRNVCELPTSDPNVFAKQLRQIRPLMKNASKLPVAEPGKQPKPWQYDPRTNKHWHPGHGHWHDGRPPNTR